MGRIVESRSSPKTRCWAYDVREENGVTANEVLGWLHDNASGDVYWTRTQFRAPHERYLVRNNRKRNFDGGYWVMRIWFTKKVDASLFRLVWMK